MIISRTPFRTSFVGGGTDIPWFYREHGGAVLSMAINKHIYITARPMFEGDAFLLKYLKHEYVKKVEEIQHPIIRAALQKYGISSIDLGVSSDFPAGSGLGSSSAFTVGLLNALRAFLVKPLGKELLAQEACNLEIDILKEPIGKQDQYASAYGGFNFFEFRKDNTVTSKSIKLSPDALEWINSALFLIPVGPSRSAGEMLREQTSQAHTNAQIVERLIELKELSEEAFVHVAQDPTYIAKILNLSWALKKLTGTSISNPLVDNLVSDGLRNGASGAKLLGAGRGGFVLFIVEPEQVHKFQTGMAKSRIIPVGIDDVGSTIIYPG